MDKETRQQLDEWFVERELSDVREAIIALLVDTLDKDHDPDCLCHDFCRWQVSVQRKRERLLRRLARLPLPEDDWGDSCEHWAIERGIDEADALEDAAAEEAAFRVIFFRELV